MSEPTAGSEDPEAASEEEGTDLEAVRYVGPATAGHLSEAGIAATDIRAKRVAYRDLIEAGTNPGVATKIRREHSLPWAVAGGSDLDRRSELVRGLRDGEREWVAASRGDDDREQSAAERGWVEASFDDEPAETDGSGTAEAAEAAWRTRSRRDPVETIPEVDEREAALLADAGAPTVRRFATGNSRRLADRTGIPPERLEELQALARDRIE